MPQQTGTFQTAHASKYLQQMCKHFSHKVEVTFDKTHGEAVLPYGPVLFDATEAVLTIEINGETAGQREKSRHIIDIHLQKFAFREGFEAMIWTKAV